MDGMSYFYSKNGGYQFRQINPNMSELVKTDPRFANTRYYSKAFGKGANWSGTLLQAISSRWRFLLRTNAHAILTQKYNEYFKYVDGLADDHGFALQNFFDSMCRDFNELNKTPIPNFVRSFFPIFTHEDTTNHELVISEDLEVPAYDLEEWMNKGAEGFIISLHTLRVTWEYVTNAQDVTWRYVGRMTPRPFTHASIAFNGSDTYTVLQASTPAIDGLLEPDVETCGGVFVYIAPYRFINGTQVTLQSLCSGFWYRPKTS